METPRHGLTAKSTYIKADMKPAFDYLMVGAGFAGAVLAKRFASRFGKTGTVELEFS
jgi:hypothetical protein